MLRFLANVSNLFRAVIFIPFWNHQQADSKRVDSPRLWTWSKVLYI